MAKKNMNSLTKIGTQVAFAAAMTAALAMPASADEVEAPAAPAAEPAPVVEAAAAIAIFDLILGGK